ncbi:MAG: chalcone isomerase family protein [Mariprofundus sp.]|nr:chalcone isomerase family protein [Mariprofundus sp.]
MKYIRLLFLTALLLLPALSPAVEIEGVALPDTIQLQGKTLQLNGAGIRTKFFFDIYVGGLYLEQHETSAKAIIADTGNKRITMNFLYAEVDKEKLTDGWDEGFDKNQSDERMQKLKDQLASFNALFTTAHRGDSIVFDLFSDGSTHISFNGTEKGEIKGLDFQQALLAVWLGKKPADKGLKKSMLGH